VNRLVLIVGGSTLIYAGLAWMMAVWPGTELSTLPAGPGVEPLTALQSEGRDVYVANGCSYCPELLGSERTGPDLTNIGVRQPSSVWQYIHLYNPRAVVPESIMPSFEWLFEVVGQAPLGVTPVTLPKSYAPAHGVVVPAHAADALIAYLASLKQPPWVESETSSGIATAGTANPAARETPTANRDPKEPGGPDTAKGASLYTANCSACHQAGGGGLPGVFPSLKDDAVVNKDDATKHIDVVLNGLRDARVSGTVYSSAMPPFAATLSDTDIADLIDYERGAWGNHGKPIIAAQVATERAKGK
jgi:cytochrome c oxidase cbb3-type subunit II